MEALIANGADVNAKTNAGETPLDCMDQWDQEEYAASIQSLRAEGALLSQKFSSA